MEILTDALKPIDGVSIGHWTNRDAQTGCTVIRFDRPALTAVDVRGAAPASRELALLAPGMAVQRPDAIVLSGGSAFGLSVADGVVRWMQEHERGFQTPAGPVPIVPAAALFDLAIGDPIAPDASAGYQAVEHALPLDELETGRVGAGTGATTGHIGGPKAISAGGFVAAQALLDEGNVLALGAINPFGAFMAAGQPDPRRSALEQHADDVPFGESTSLLAIVTDIPLSHDALQRITISMHDALARCVAPVHTLADGDIAFASTTTEADATPPERTMRITMAAEIAMESAIDMLQLQRDT